MDGVMQLVKNQTNTPGGSSIFTMHSSASSTPPTKMDKHPVPRVVTSGLANEVGLFVNPQPGGDDFEHVC
jgi:hypothetical protein